MTTETPARVSMRTQDAYEGGGSSLDGKTFEIIEAETCIRASEQYGDKAALRLEWRIEGYDDPWERHYNAGKATMYDADGDFIIMKRPLRPGESTGLDRRSALYRFLEQLETAAPQVAAAFDTEGASALKGLKGTIQTLPAAEGSGGKPLLAIGTVIGQPTTATTKSNGQATAEQVSATTETAIRGLLKDDQTIKVKELPRLLMEEHKADPLIREMAQLARDLDWVGGADRPWTFNEKRGTLSA